MRKTFAVCVILFLVASIWGLACNSVPPFSEKPDTNETTQFEQTLDNEQLREISDKYPEFKVISTDLDSNQLIFSQKETKIFLLYNNGNTDLIITSFLIDKDALNAFSLVDKPLLPLTLKSGKDNGVSIKVKYSSTQTSGYFASLQIASDADNINNEGFFTVALFYQ